MPQDIMIGTAEGQEPQANPATIDAQGAPPATAKAIAPSWARLGLRVFPVARIGHTKTPWVRWLSEATTDPAIIEAWFDRWPTLVAGVVMEGVVAIDFDDPMALLNHGYDWPATWQQKTRRGIHYIYRGDAPCSVKVLAPDIDTRGTYNGKSGYVVAYALAPDSLDAFAPAPPWLIEWAAGRSQKHDPHFANDNDAEYDTPANIKRALDALLSFGPGKGTERPRLVPDGYRNNFIYQAAREVQKYDLTQEAALELLVTEFEWEGSFDENVSALESAFGTRHPEAGVLNPQRVFAGAAAEIAAQTQDEQSRRQEDGTHGKRDPWAPPYRHEDLDRVRKDNPPPTYLVPHWVLGGFNNVLAGASKAFKSYFGAGHLATLGMGYTLDGAECERVYAAMLSYEDPIRPLMDRLAAVVEYAATAAKRVVHPGHEVIDFQPEKHRHRLMIVTPDGEVIEQDDWKRLYDRMLAMSGRKFVLLDSFYNAFDFRGASKVNESAVMEVLGRLDGLCTMADMTIETVAHPSRTAQKENMQSMGFSNAMDAGPRHRVYASRIPDVAGATMRVAANQYGADGYTETYYLERGVLRPKHPTGHIPLAAAILETVAGGIGTGQYVRRNQAKRADRRGVELPDYMVTEIERLSGSRATRMAIRQTLDLEVDAGRWKYWPGTSHDLAGYRPIPVEQQAGYRQGGEEPRPDLGAEIPDGVG